MGIWRQRPLKAGHEILSYSGNPSTREKHMHLAYSGNLRLHLSHSLSNIIKQQKRGKKKKKKTNAKIAK